nr:hypothetical protein [uncultured Draconibacterium sp.]
MRNIYQILLLGIISILYSCSNSIPKDVEQALKFAEDNRVELEKVINHYKNNDDSLKLEAAYFLIKNMPYHVFFEIREKEKFDALFDSISTLTISNKSGDVVFDNELRGNLIDNYVRNFFKNNYPKKYRGQIRSDIQTIDSEYLIENIDYAFKAWEFPWAKHYSFYEFCRYILPYRYANEQPDRSRKQFYEQYRWIVDSIKNPGDVIEVTSFINKLLRNKVAHCPALKELGNNIQASHLATGMVVESCEGQTGLGQSILRAIGVPTSIVTIPWWGIYSGGHETSAVLDSTKRWIDFGFYDLDPTPELLGCVAPKMYFKQFDMVGKPQIDNHFFYKDVSNYFQQVQHIELDIKKDDRDINLCVFGDRGWAPICKAEKDSTGIVFKNVGIKNYMFIASTIQDDQFVPVSYPFTTDSAGHPKYYIPDTSFAFSYTFDRKFPPYVREDRCDDLKGGQFQFSSDNNFTSYKTIYKIEDRLKYQNNIMKITPTKGRYFRYVFPEGIDLCYNGPAEVSFYTSNSKGLQKLKGHIVGSKQLSREQINILTDADMLTFVEWRTNTKLRNDETGNIIIKKQAEEPIWIGLELDSVTEVTHVGICPRNDKNNIYQGMYYELMYWDKGWKSLGMKEAIADTITYANIPGNALLWLRNHTEGKEERIFTLKDNEQVWW